MKGFLGCLMTVETVLASVFCTLAVAFLFGDVIAREVLSTPIWGAQRAALLSSNAAALLGMAIAVGLNRHLRPTVLDWVLPEALQGAGQRLGHLVSAATLLAGAWYATLLVLDNRAMGFTAPPLSLQIWIPQIALPYALASSGLRYLCFAFRPDLLPVEGVAT